MDYEDIIEEFRKELDQLGVDDDFVASLTGTESEMLVISLRLQRQINSLPIMAKWG